jgi:hypothetical protein
VDHHENAPCDRAAGIKPQRLERHQLRVVHPVRIFVSERGMHQLLPQLLPWFTWITWPRFFIGVVWSFLCGWYVAVIFVPLFNFFSARTE